MSGPPLRDAMRRVDRNPHPTFVGALCALGSLALLVSPAAAQYGLTNPATGTRISPTVQVITTALTGLVVGGLLLALAPDYTERTTDRILESPGETLVYGLGIGLATLVVVFLLAITVIGVLLAIPIIIALAVVSLLGYLAVGRAVADDGAIVLLVAVVVYTICGVVPIVGFLVGFGLASAGIGAAYLDYTGDGGGSGRRSSGGRSSRRGPTGGSRPGDGTGGRTTSRGDDGREWGSWGHTGDDSESARGDEGGRN